MFYIEIKEFLMFSFFFNRQWAYWFLNQGLRDNNLCCCNGLHWRACLFFSKLVNGNVLIMKLSLK